MPTYEYRCAECSNVSEHVCSARDKPKTIKCQHCDADAVAIVSATAVRLSNSSKIARQDPKYDKMVDKAMRSTTAADPDAYLKRMKPLSGED